ncbi:MAG: hypothetical protein JSU61_05855 [Fidelibacterota bacterium]|nr:MAG: hypothetical protein JSU61_05855 [Candidatus Neomarinimicrobiota bacterium]
MNGKAMTKHDRYLAALRCEEPDRVPIVVRGVNPMFGEAGLPPSKHPSFQPLIDVVTEKTEWAYRWHPAEENLLSAHPEAMVTVERKSCDQEGFEEEVKTFTTPLGPLTSIEWVSLEGKPGMTKEYLIETLEDVDRFLSIPFEFQPPDPSGFFDLKKRMGANGVLMASIGLDPIGHVTHWLGLETLAIWTLTEKDAVFRLLDEFYRRAQLLITSLLAAQVGPVFATLGMEQATPPWLSTDDFRAYVTGYDQRLWAPILEEGGVIHVHCHGNLRDVIPDFISMGAGCLHPVEAPPMGDIQLSEAKAMMAGRICIEGNIQLDDLYTKDEDYIREVVRTAVRDAADRGGFVLCPTASPIPPVLEDKVLGNYLALIEAGLEYGAIYT